MPSSLNVSLQLLSVLECLPPLSLSHSRSRSFSSCTTLKIVDCVANLLFRIDYFAWSVTCCYFTIVICLFLLDYVNRSRVIMKNTLKVTNVCMFATRQIASKWQTNEKWEFYFQFVLANICFVCRFVRQSVSQSGKGSCIEFDGRNKQYNAHYPYLSLIPWSHGTRLAVNKRKFNFPISLQTKYNISQQSNNGNPLARHP